jgi:predicted nucleotide-binding protein (sugar kinase/HSP70/actin superfamily)
VMIIGEFWAMTTEGAGNYHLQRFLESEGAEVDVQPVAAWLLYMIWQNRRDTRRRLSLRGEDEAGKGLANRNGPRLLRTLWVAERMLRGVYRAFAACIGMERAHLPDMEQIAMLAQPYYDVELRGGEGHMEVGKLIQAVTEKKAHMVVSVKPFGCMPSSGVSDGIQSAVLHRLPEAIFCPVETTGDGAVNFQSRVLMCLFRARRRAMEEFEAALQRRGVTADEAARRIAVRHARATHYPKHEVAGTAANEVLALWTERGRGKC